MYRLLLGQYGTGVSNGPMSLCIPQIRHVWALSSYTVTKWKVIEGRKISLGFASTSVISLGNYLSSEGVER